MSTRLQVVMEPLAGCGETVRSMLDCLVADIAVREGRPLLARGRAFDLIARHVGLELVTTSGA